MNRLFVALPRLLIVLIAPVALACHRDAGPAQPGDTQAGRALSAPPTAPDVTPLPGPDAKQLSVVAARPQGELQGLARPTITFNKPVVALSTLEQGGAGPAGQFVIEPAAAGQWRWLGSASVEFVPAEPLA